MSLDREPLETVITLEFVGVGLVHLHNVGPKLFLSDILEEFNIYEIVI